MIELGMIRIRDEASIIEARNKVRLLAADLKFNSVEATRLATIISELSRIVYQEDGESSVVVGFDKKADRFDLALIFESKKEELDIGMAEIFFDRVDTFRTGDGLQRVEAFKYLPDPEFKPTKKFIDTERERLVRLSRAELLSEGKRKNEELRGLYDDLKKARDYLEIRVQERTAELLKANALLKHEISERKQAEKALKESEKKYRDFADLLPQTVFELDEAGNFTFVNLSSLEIFDYALEDSDSGWNALQIFAPEDRGSVKENIQRVLSGAELSGIEYKALKKDGSTFPVVIYASPIIEENKVVGLRGIIVDITERKKTEEALREREASLTEAQRIAHLGNWDWDIVKNKVVCSDEVYRIFGRTAQDFKEAHSTFLSSVHPKDKELIEKSINEALYEGKSYNIEYSIVLPDGSVRIVHKKVTVTLDESGKPIRMVGTVQDITERRKMEEQLIITDRLASVGELAAGIAHELNNPLTSVIGFSDLLLQRDVPDDVKKDLEVINREARRTAGVVRNLLTFSRKHAPEKQPVNINKIIQTVLALRAYEQQVNNIEVNTSLTADLPEIMANAFQLQQVFLNIIINAEHFMVEAYRKGTLTITTERVGDIIKASLADDGPGIPKENLGHLFDPFFTTKEIGKGTGLGLSISYGIITEHGGKIYAESEPGKGATFIVELPVSPLDDEGIKNENS